MSEAPDPSARARGRYADLDVGDFSGIDALIVELESRGQEADLAHAAALRAHLWFADLPGGRFPESHVLAPWASNAACREPLLRIVQLSQERGLLFFELGSQDAPIPGIQPLDSDEDALAIGVEFARLRPLALSATPESAEAIDDRLRSVFDRAKAAGLAALAIDVQCAMVMVRLLGGDLTNATVTARRASRMARTEGFPRQQYLANILLARVRRLNGVPHLATHILNALKSIAPSPYQGWIRWERLLAGAIVGHEREPRSPVERAAHALERQLSAAGGGDRKALTDSRAELLGLVARFPLVAMEVGDLCVALDSELSVDVASEAMRSWLLGHSPLPPHGLYGAQAVQEDVSEAEDVGVVVAGPGRLPRRLLGTAADPSGTLSVCATDRLQRRKTRVETGLAVLALCSPSSLADTEFFRRVYGFEFNPAVHPTVLDTLVSRMRKRVEPVGALHRQGGQLHIEFHRPAVLPDPRCAQPLEDRVLRVLVRAQSGTAKDAAARLGLPLRTIQDALKELTEGGACSKRREGRQIAYVVEDTTFAPPTQSGSDLNRDL